MKHHLTEPTEIDPVDAVEPLALKLRKFRRRSLIGIAMSKLKTELLPELVDDIKQLFYEITIEEIQNAHSVQMRYWQTRLGRLSSFIAEEDNWNRWLSVELFTVEPIVTHRILRYDLDKGIFADKTDLGYTQASKYMASSAARKMHSELGITDCIVMLTWDKMQHKGYVFNEKFSVWPRQFIQ